MRVSSAFIPDSQFRQLVRSLVAADRDTDKIAMALGKVGGLWPDSVRKDLERDERLAKKAKQVPQGSLGD